MPSVLKVTALATLVLVTSALKYDPDQVLWNLNQNQSATSGLDYWGEWQNHSKSRFVRNSGVG